MQVNHNPTDSISLSAHKLNNRLGTLYCKVQDVEKLKRLPTKEQLQSLWHLLKAIHKSIHHDHAHWPEDLQLKVFRCKRILGSSSGQFFGDTYGIFHTFQEQACTYFKKLTYQNI